MAEVNLSMWVGKPPTKPTAADVAGLHADHTEGEEEDLSEHTPVSQSPQSESVPSKAVNVSPRGGGQEEDRSDNLSHSSQTPLENGFIVDIPKISNKEDYEHLPGYFTVRRIFREVSPRQYLVELKSGEVDLVGEPFDNLLYPPLPSLTEDLYFLQHFHRTIFLTSDLSIAYQQETSRIRQLGICSGTIPFI